MWQKLSSFYFQNKILGVCLGFVCVQIQKDVSISLNLQCLLRRCETEVVHFYRPGSIH